MSGGQQGEADEPWGIHVCALVDEQVDDEDVSAGTGGVEGEDAVEDGVDGLAMGEGVLDEADVARGGGGVEAEMGDCGGVSGGTRERKHIHSVATLYLTCRRSWRDGGGIPHRLVESQEKSKTID